MALNSILPRLPSTPTAAPATALAAVKDDYHRFVAGLPNSLEAYILDRYGIDLTTTYAGIRIKNPWGKASGQLSMTVNQVAEDASSGLGFCVLKTVIAQDILGTQSMAAWAIPESRMLAEPITSQDGESGWTITWKGRGWSSTFDSYLEFVRSARAVGEAANMLVIPSCKFHLRGPGETEWRTAEYDHTIQQLLENYGPVMPIEKDFSPTLAGDDRASQRTRIIEWVTTVPRLMRGAANAAAGRVVVGLKLFNSLLGDGFQCDMLNAVIGAGAHRPDFIVYANRLFNPDREFAGQRGVAYGGPDLRARNLRILDQLREQRRAAPIEISATGDICTGRAAVEYLLRGATSFQLHTFFQLPSTEYVMRAGSKIEKALHSLYFHPETGFISWIIHIANVLGIPQYPIQLPILAHAASAPCHQERLEGGSLS